MLTSTPPVLAQVTSAPQTSGGIAGTSVFPSLGSTAPGSVTGFGTVGAPGTTIQNGLGQNGVGQNGVTGQNGVAGGGSTSPGTTFGSTTPGATTNGTAGAGGTGTGGGAAGIPGGGGTCDDAIFGVIC